MKRVEEVMERNPVTVCPSASIIEVARRMKEHNLQMILVCENNKLRGVITEGDIISGIVASARNPRRQEAKSLMQYDGPKISPGDDLLSAAKLMARHGTHYLPVVQNGKMKGLLTLDHLVNESLAAASLVLDRTRRQPGPAITAPAGV
ncbi:MAG: CBS domain-containing protein [Dehalococcoidia bacterium]